MAHGTLMALRCNGVRHFEGKVADELVAIGFARITDHDLCTTKDGDNAVGRIRPIPK
jgi:hypothetical protein